MNDILFYFRQLFCTANAVISDFYSIDSWILCEFQFHAIEMRTWKMDVDLLLSY